MSKSKFTLSVFFMFLFAFAAFGQNQFDTDEPNRPQERRGEIISRVLGLSPEQQLQIRELNKSNRDNIRNAQENLRNAKAELDRAIYADNYDETDLQNKLKAVVEAQAEITKLRATNELAVRKLLTPEQVVKFRNLRQRFAEQREQRQIRRQQRPNRRQNRMRRN